MLYRPAACPNCRLLRLVTARQALTASDVGRIENVLFRDDFVRRIVPYYNCQNHVLGNTGQVQVT